MEAGLYGFLTAFLTCAVVSAGRRLLPVTLDETGSGPQKFHAIPTPRIGGIPIMLGLVAGVMALGKGVGPASWLSAMLVVSAIPAFFGGLAEDLTRRVPIATRLLLTFVSAGIGFYLQDARITEVSVPGLDWLLGFGFASFAFTLFATGGFANAMNIVDGFNGLAGTVALVYLAGIAYVAHAVGDGSLLLACLLLGSSIAGFLIFNFPRGLLFLGDGGAYAIGFMVAELAVLLVQRNSSVSPWFALTLFAYPAWETLFSIYRKRVLRGRSPGQPDGLHLHMLVHKRVVRRLVGRRPNQGFWANSLTSPFLWALALLGAVPAVLLWDSTWALQVCAAAFILIYSWLYRRLVRFDTLRGKLLARWRLGYARPTRHREALRE